MGLNGHAAIVKAAPKPRQHFWPFLRVDRDRAERNRALSPIVATGSVPDFLLMLSPLRILIAPLFGITFLLSVMFPPAGLYRGVSPFVSQLCTGLRGLLRRPVRMMNWVA